MRYAKHVTAPVPQSEPLPNQEKNSAGGFCWSVDCWTRLDRFLILGCEGGSYYASERTLTRENAAAVLECAKQNPRRTVDRIVEISTAGRAPKNDPAVFALALLASENLLANIALEAMPKVCRIGTHLFQFVEAVTQFRGWGRGLRRAVAQWYTGRKPDALAYQVTKYQQRGGWSHRDLLRLAHPASTDHNALFRYVTCGRDGLGVARTVGRVDGPQRSYPAFGDHLPALIHAVEQVKAATSLKEVLSLIREHGLVREHLPTEWLNKPEVWDALLDKMPPTAMLRNLGKMSNVGLLKPLSAGARLVSERLRDREALNRARVHPLSVLTAQTVYQHGRGVKGSLTWQPAREITAALEDAFYLAFDAVTPTNKRYLLALDVSGSMTGGQVGGSFLSPREASAAMALVTTKTEPWHHTVGFSRGLTELHLGNRLMDAITAVSGLPFDGTDCAQPMLYALQEKLEVDAFVIYTDSETWYGDIHPSQALKKYRDKMGIPAKLIVNGMLANDFSIADPNDAGMLDVVGFDTAVPQIMAEFVTGGQVAPADG